MIAYLLVKPHCSLCNVWAALREKVRNRLSRCHAKRRTPFFWYDTDFLDFFLKIIFGFFFFFFFFF